MPDSISELLRFLDGESDRFWRRFHIFTALQIGAVIAFARVADVLKSHGLLHARPAVFRILLLFMTVFSFVGAIAITRGCDLQLALAKAINDAYEEFDDESIGPNVYMAVSNDSWFRSHAGTITASLFSWLCAVIWPATWFTVRHRGFTFDAPPVAHDPQTTDRFGKRKLIIAGVLAATLFLLVFHVILPSSIAIVLCSVLVVATVLTGFACVSAHVVCEVPSAVRVLRACLRAEEDTDESPQQAVDSDEPMKSP